MLATALYACIEYLSHYQISKRLVAALPRFRNYSSGCQVIKNSAQSIQERARLLSSHGLCVWRDRNSISHGRAQNTKNQILGS